MLTERGTEYCGAPERHEYEPYLAVENIDHTRTKTKRPQTNGICERFHKTLLNEFYRVTFRKQIYQTMEALQADLDAGIQRAAITSALMVLWENPDADLAKQCGDCQGENVSRLILTGLTVCQMKS